MDRSLKGFLSSLLLSGWETDLFADPNYPALKMLFLGVKWAFESSFLLPDFPHTTHYDAAILVPSLCSQ